MTAGDDRMGPKIRVVIADDNAIIRRRFVNLINSAEDMLLIAEASCGAELIALTHESEVDVILTDIEMENRLDGITAAMKLIGEKPGLKVIFITVHEDQDTIFSAFELANIDYIMKDATSEEILISVRNAYNDNIYIKPNIAKKLSGEFARIRKNETGILQLMHIISTITPSEKEIIGLLLKGYKIKNIAGMRFVVERTVKCQVTTILRKFGVKRCSDILRKIKESKLESYFD